MMTDVGESDTMADSPADRACSSRARLEPTPARIARVRNELAVSFASPYSPVRAGSGRRPGSSATRRSIPPLLRAVAGLGAAGLLRRTFGKFRVVDLAGELAGAALRN